MKDAKVIPLILELYLNGIRKGSISHREHSALEVLCQDTIKTLEKTYGFDMTEYRRQYKEYLKQRD